MDKILDAKYHKADLQTDIVDQCSTKHNELFDGTPGMRKNFQYNIELQDGARLYHGNLYTKPKAYEATLCMEVECLCCIGVIYKANWSK
eukprot:10326256-Ditylum_brightwellii.AAC.1